MIQRKRMYPGPGQESVWDYPRPPRMEKTTRHLVVIFNDIVIAETRRGFRMLETSHPPTYYFPPEDVQLAQYFTRTPNATFCDWKGEALYYTITVGDKCAVNAAWYYPHPFSLYEEAAGYVSFYPRKVDACFVDGERVQPQEGALYGGWITKDLIGPFKGGPGSTGW
ncbi:MAG TPA: DUF427 domain-containing protein [Ktedonobacterales bacterium]